MRKTPVFIVFLTLISVIFTACSGTTSDPNLSKHLDELDKCLENADKYDNVKLHRLDSLRKILTNTPAADYRKRWQLNMELGEQYLAFCSDSSAYFYSHAQKIANAHNMEEEDIDSKLCLTNAQSAAGLFTLAYVSLSSLDTTLLSHDQHLEYAKVARQLYSYMHEYSKGHEDETGRYSQKEHEYEQYLIDNLPSDSNYRLFLYAQKLHRSGLNAEARKIASSLLEKLPVNSNLFGMTAYLMAGIARSDGNDTEYGKFLTIASLSDVKASVKETMALPALAKWLYNKGEVDRAYHYINTSLQDAMASNARMRTVEIASLLPLVDDSYRKKISSSRDELMLYLALVVLLFVIAGALLAAMFRNMRRTSSINRKLAQQTKVQESYIGHFLGLCSSYSEKLESMRRLVNRKITAGQTDELLKMLKSGKYTDPENDNFFAVFDETFLDLYPAFMDELNQLLRPECQLSHKKGTPLSTEIRIYAFVRLGVEESVKIAQILHCSVSTIYTYRNRMRGRAINRETFETDVMAIGAQPDLG